MICRYIVAMSNFKSLDSRINNVTDLCRWAGNIFLFQNVFVKRTTPWEKSQWDEERLEAFRINPERTDRVYFIGSWIDDFSQEFLLVVRQEYEGGFIFIELNAVISHNVFCCSNCTEKEVIEKAVIYISEGSNFFINILAMNEHRYPLSLIQQSLAEDGPVVIPPFVGRPRSNGFKSLNPRVTCVADIDRLIGPALLFQEDFEKRPTLWEKQRWDNETLAAFRIDRVCIDRIYFVDNGIKYYSLVVRQKLKNGFIYVELNGKCSIHGFISSQHTDDAVIYISDDLYCFMDHLDRRKRYPMDVIQKSLANDGIVINRGKNPHMLTHLCLRTISNHRDTLKTKIATLPKILRDSVDDFKKNKSKK